MTIIDEARALLKRSAEAPLPDFHIGEAAIALLQKLVEPPPVPQASASRRREQAKVAINAAIASAESDDAGIEELIEHRDNLIEVLDELTDPPTIGMPELIRDFRERLAERGWLGVLGVGAAGSDSPNTRIIEGYRLGLADGEQYAHERWEPADRPSQEQMLRWLGIQHHADAEGCGDRIHITAQSIEKEVI